MTRSVKFIRKILVNEGGSKITNDPADSGGLTKYGICQKSFPHLDIRNLTEDQAIEIYIKMYCVPCMIDAFDDELLALHIFDFAVNSGVSNSIETLQSLLKVKVDGRIGKITINAANSDNTITERFIQARKDFYTRLAVQSLNKYEVKIKRQATLNEKMTKTNYRFLKGWMNRINNLKL